MNKRRLILISGLLLIILAILLLFLFRQAVLTDKIGVVLVWLLPMVFCLHVTEEFVFPGGFSTWAKTYQPRYSGLRTPSFLFKLNAIVGIVAVLVVLGSFNYRDGYSFWGIRAWLGFLSTLVFNAFYHIYGALQTKRYSPGMITASLLYLPLAVISFGYFLKTGVINLLWAVICFIWGRLFQLVLDSRREGILKSKA